MPCRRRRLLRRLGCLLGACATAAGCQTTKGPPPHATPPMIAAAAEKTTSSAERKWGIFTAAKPAPKKDATAGSWRPAARPADYAASGGVVPTGYPVAGDAAPDLAGAAELEPPKLEDPRALEMAPPRLVPLPTHGSPAPREVAHTLIGPVAQHTPRELFKQAMPAYRVEPPDILLVEILAAKEGGEKPPAKADKDDKPPGGGRGDVDALNAVQPIRGPHLVRPDGTIGLGVYGSVYVGGMTLDEARRTIADYLTATRVRVDPRDVNVDVISYNSKYVYVIIDGGGQGEPVQALAYTGSETVLDAIAKVGGFPPVSDKTKVWVARRGPGAKGQILPVDWVGIAQHGGTDSNYQLAPGDRIYVKADHWLKFDTELGKRLTPIERIFGGILLGSEAVNSVRNRGTTTSR